MEIRKFVDGMGRTNGPSLGPRKGRQHYARMTVLSFCYGGMNAQWQAFHGRASYMSGEPQHHRFWAILAFDNSGLTEIDF